MSDIRKVNTWTVGPYMFEQYDSEAFGTSYKYEFPGSKSHLHYETLEEAMVAAVVEPYVGPPKASGEGVAPPDGWFFAMLRGMQRE